MQIGNKKAKTWHAVADLLLLYLSRITIWAITCRHQIKLTVVMLALKIMSFFLKKKYFHKILYDNILSIYCLRFIFRKCFRFFFIFEVFLENINLNFLQEIRHVTIGVSKLENVKQVFMTENNWASFAYFLCIG